MRAWAAVRIDASRQNQSHGTGQFRLQDFRRIGQNVILEAGVLVFHPETIELGDNVYVGHNTILKGYYRGAFLIGDHTWIGQGCFFHSAGNITIGRAVGIGPMVKVLTSAHEGAADLDAPILCSPLRFAPVVVEDGCDIGIGAILLPGVTIGEGAVVGAGSVVTTDVPGYEVWAGVPARCLRSRRDRPAHS